MKIARRGLSVGVTALALAGFDPACARVNSPADIISSVQKRGAAAVVAGIWASESQTNAVLAGVRSGDAKWLAVAKALAPGVDAGSAEDLNDALAVALLNRPYPVMVLLKDAWWQESGVCAFAADSELPGGVAHYVARLRRALNQAPPPGFAALRQECLEGILKTQAGLKPEG